MIASGSWLELLLVFVLVMAIGGLVVLGIFVADFRQKPSWKLYAVSVVGAFGLLVLNTIWNMIAV